MGYRCLFVTAAALLLTTGCAPKLRYSAPTGWTSVGSSGQSDAASDTVEVTLKHERTGANAVIDCAPADDDSLALTLVLSLVTLAETHGRVVSSSIADDQRSYRLAFVLEDEGARMSGRQVAWLTSGKKPRLIVVSGLWPTDRDAAMSADFEKIVASTSFR